MHAQGQQIHSVRTNWAYECGVWYDSKQNCTVIEWLLTCAQSTEVLTSLGAHIRKEFKDYTSSWNTMLESVNKICCNCLPKFIRFEIPLHIVFDQFCEIIEITFELVRINFYIEAIFQTVIY